MRVNRNSSITVATLGIFISPLCMVSSREDNPITETDGDMWLRNKLYVSIEENLNRLSIFGNMDAAPFEEDLCSKTVYKTGSVGGFQRPPKKILPKGDRKKFH